MAIEVIVKVFPGGMRVVNIAEASKLDHLMGQEVTARIYKPRNIKFHRLFFALLKTTLDMADVEMNLEQWRHIILTGSGHCDYFKYNDKTIAVPRSISFAAMDEAEFSVLYDNCLNFICANYIHDTPEDINIILRFM